MAEISEFQYAYFSCDRAMIRIKIPMTRITSYEPKVERVFYTPDNPLPKGMGFFSHHHILYMVGGYINQPTMLEYSYLFHMFDPTKHEFPEPVSINSKFAPIACPYVIRVGNGMYLLSRSDFLLKSLDLDSDVDVNEPFYFHFQYFDPTQNLFETLTPPPFPPSSYLVGVVCYFYLRGYIYLFARGGSNYFYGYKFNTSKSEWEDCKSLWDRFEEKNICFPIAHVGDMVISDEFINDTWILVALSVCHPTAYYVRLSGGGDIEPLSHRVLTECNIFGDNKYEENFIWTHLVDMGGGSFCVMCSTSDVNYLIYVFRINFELEYDIQTSPPGTERHSTQVIFSKQFNPDLIIPEKKLSYTGFGIASALPAPASPSNEDQDMDDGKMKRKREE